VAVGGGGGVVGEGHDWVGVGCKVGVGDLRAVGERGGQGGAALVEGRGMVVGTGGAMAKAAKPRQ
jgi:hypothetical protein